MSPSMLKHLSQHLGIYVKTFASLCILAFAGYVVMPTLNPWFIGPYFFAALAILPWCVRITKPLEEDRYSRSEYVIGTDKYFLLAILTLAVIIFVIAPLLSVEIGRSDRFHQMLGAPKVSSFAQDVAPIEGEYRLVTEKSAQNIGGKSLGTIPGLGSRAELGNFDIQKVRGKLYWVAPVLHNGLFQYWNFGDEGTPAYVMVSVSNPDDVEFVRDYGKDHHPVAIRYQPQAYFSKNLARQLYLGGYATEGRTDYTFEVDEDGKPYYVVTLYEHAIGFGAQNATGIVTVDVETGEMKKYSIAEAPEWIDRIQPEEIVHEQISWWGEYGGGWWNAWLVGNNLLKVSSGKDHGKELRMVFGEDGGIYWYSELTSSGKDGSMNAFLLTNTRTKETRRYDIPNGGATCGAAEGSAEGATQAQHYDAQNFILYNVAGKPTCVGPLMDKAGLMKGVAMVSVENYNILGWGSTVQDALRAYRSALASHGNAVSSDPLERQMVTTGVVGRRNQETRDGQTYHYFTLGNQPGMLFVGTSKVSPALTIFQSGDAVTVGYRQTGSGLVDVESFENHSYDIAVSPGEKRAAEHAAYDRK